LFRSSSSAPLFPFARVERERVKLDPFPASSNVELEAVGALLLGIDVEIAHRDRIAERRRGSSARHRSDRASVEKDRHALARDAPALEAESAEPPSHAARLSLEERLLPQELDRLVEVEREGEAGLERIGRLVDLVAVERHAGLEPERVAGAEPDRRGSISTRREH